jgi:hypothetical protein
VGEVQWMISRDIWVNLNGRAIRTSGSTPFGNLLARVALGSMFSIIRKDIAVAADDFTTNLISVEFSFRVGGEVIYFTQTDRPIDPIDVYPLFIPCLARVMFEPQPRPYDRLKTGASSQATATCSGATLSSNTRRNSSSSRRTLRVRRQAKCNGTDSGL